VLVAGFAGGGGKAGNQHMKRQAAARGGKFSIGTTKDGEAMLWEALCYNSAPHNVYACRS